MIDKLEFISVLYSRNKYLILLYERRGKYENINGKYNSK